MSGSLLQGFPVQGREAIGPQRCLQTVFVAPDWAVCLLEQDANSEKVIFGSFPFRIQITTELALATTISVSLNRSA